MNVTPRQRDALDFIRVFHGKHAASPTFAQIAVGIGLKSKSGIHRIISGLEERGLIRRLPNRARAIELVSDRTVRLTDEALQKVKFVCDLTGLSRDEVVAEALKRWRVAA